MSHQTDINEKMRGILIDWLIEVHYKLELLGETLFLTVNIIDRYLAQENVVRKKLQLVGVMAMLLACKYEEVSVPVVDDLILICDRAYTRADILEMGLESNFCFGMEFSHVHVARARMLVKLRGEDRPTMRQVELTLEGYSGSKKHILDHALPKKVEKNDVATYCLSTNVRRGGEESTRCYSMEEEFMLSASYPR